MQKRRLGLLSAILGVAVGAVVGAAAQELPRATALPGKPFYLKKTWIIGGEGNWDYLTVDPDAMRLFVAHGASVQVVDVSAGAVVGQIDGLRDAHDIALDDTGMQGFISDGGANRVRIFDRRSLRVTASAATGPSPRAMVYEPETKLLFVICSQPVSEAALDRLAHDEDEPAAAGRRRAHASSSTQPSAGQTRQPAGAQQQGSEEVSVVSVIDSSSNKTLGHLLLAGHLGYALADDHGEVYVSVIDHNRIAHFNAQTVLNALQQQVAANTAESIPMLDWSGVTRHDTGGHQLSASTGHVDSYRLGADCRSPRGLAMDGQNLRLFAACDNQKLQVLNSGTGEIVTTLTIGAGTDAIGYDADRGLIYTANGAGTGSVTVIRRDVAATYAVIQDLPTKQRARTLAVNSANGEVYLVTNLQASAFSKPGTGGSAHTLPVVQTGAAQGSFQVLVVSN